MIKVGMILDAEQKELQAIHVWQHPEHDSSGQPCHLVITWQSLEPAIGHNPFVIRAEGGGEWRGRRQGK